ncbi:syntaxin, putative [Schistosoma mansoni]|uniref:syntaxin, putative n=1 Tax=Schistosoma mansoni TaxID=6183 RepID=UPI0001A626A1|nr:syntaxin, putative [Schistosoma mansoni]|eukprot:XP_018645693.1 syntaxin, putative [Schistosoma mansoni]
MAKDLFAVLRQNNELPNLPSAEEAVVVDGGSQMDLFFSEVEWIRREIEKTRIEISQVKTKHGEILSALQQNPKTKTQLEELNESITRSAKEIRLKLKSLEQTIREQEANDATSADLRIRKTQFLTLSKTITTIMHQYGRIQVEHKERCKALLKRQLEVGELVIFIRDIITDTQQARQNLADIEARHEDIMKLEKSIRELHGLFTDMAALIETQGELVDRIDVNVKQTQDYVAEARQETKKAVVYKKKSRKKKFIIIGVCCAIVVIIIIIVIATVVPKK